MFLPRRTMDIRSIDPTIRRIFDRRRRQRDLVTLARARSFPRRIPELNRADTRLATSPSPRQTIAS